MTASNLLCALLIFVFGSAHAMCPPYTPEQIAALAQESRDTLNTLFERERAAAGDEISRNLALVSVALAAEGKLDARAVEALSAYVDANPDDQFAKLYEGYAWVFSAGELNRRKNYLRAAEDIKRGFFLIDEAVDSEPDNWRLRYLRLRMDAFVPETLGRYVIALKDAAILSETLAQLPPALPPLLEALRAAAVERADKLPESECWLRNIVTADELNTILVPVLERQS